MDGVGEWATTSVGVGSHENLELHAGDPLPALARSPLLGLHLLPGLQGQRRRVQGHGPRPVWRADLRQPRFATLSSTSEEDGSFAWTCSTSTTAPAWSMTNERFDRLFEGPAAEGRPSPSPSATWTWRGSVQLVDRGDDPAHLRGGSRRETGQREPLPGGRGGAELRRQRPHSPRGPLRSHLGAAGGGRRRRRAGRRPLDRPRDGRRTP